MLVVSPWTKGGWVCSQTFDHTSLIQFIEKRFARRNRDLVEANITPWRRTVCGDLTSAFNFAAVDRSVPALPKPSLADTRVLTSDCPTKSLGLVTEQTGVELLGPTLPTNPVPPNSTPTQEAGSAPAPSGPVACAPTPAPRRNLIGGLLDSILGLITHL
jgi:phospholipase C